MSLAHRLLVRSVVLSFVLSLAGCGSWRPMPVEVGVTPVVDGRHPVRVTRTDSSTVILSRPAVIGDSLVGEVGFPPVRTAVALADVRGLEELRASRGRSAAAAGAGLGMLTVLAGFVLAGVAIAVLAAVAG